MNDNTYYYQSRVAELENEVMSNKLAATRVLCALNTYIERTSSNPPTATETQELVDTITSILAPRVSVSVL